MPTIAILYHPLIPRSQPLALAIEAWLRERQVNTWMGSTWDGQVQERLSQDTDWLVVLGGDGSILRAARYAAACGIPLFSINLGKLGFLSEVSPDEWPNKLSQILDGDYWLEPRLMLQAIWQRDGQPIGQQMALNEFVIGRGHQARVIYLKMYVDGDYVTRYAADGLIIATPTGSTAYAMAAGGPILPPQLPNYLVIPVAPHLGLNRALILPENAAVTIEVQMDHEANLTADGQDTIALQDGDRILIQKHHLQTHFARVGSSGYFYDRLMQRLGLSKE
ncbi:MAG: NAD(+)/NADH kinase [Anaerolineae bacterium]|nr:NAD(+)/NADH kinase [Anaerolineae bacterium]